MAFYCLSREGQGETETSVLPQLLSDVDNLEAAFTLALTVIKAERSFV